MGNAMFHPSEQHLTTKWPTSTKNMTRKTKERHLTKQLVEFLQMVGKKLYAVCGNSVLNP